MSILIKGIDLPKDKDRIYLLIEGNKCFNALDPLQTLAEAIQIPTPHGRIIDEKELKTKIHDVTLEGGVLHGCIDKTVIHEVPTILEAEEE